MNKQKRLETYRKSQKQRSLQKKAAGFSQISCWVKSDTKKKIYDIKEIDGFKSIGEVIDLKFNNSRTCD